MTEATYRAPTKSPQILQARLEKLQKSWHGASMTRHREAVGGESDRAGETEFLVSLHTLNFLRRRRASPLRRNSHGTPHPQKFPSCYRRA